MIMAEKAYVVFENDSYLIVSASNEPIAQFQTLSEVALDNSYHLHLKPDQLEVLVNNVESSVSFEGKNEYVGIDMNNVYLDVVPDICSTEQMVNGTYYLEHLSLDDVAWNELLSNINDLGYNIT